MNTDELEAMRALSARLSEWGVHGAGDKAKVFITDLVARGWIMDAKAKPTPRHPPPAEECDQHPGEWRINCRLHAADRKAARDEAAADAALASKLTREQAIHQARQAVRNSLPTPAVPVPADHAQEETL